MSSTNPMDTLTAKLPAGWKAELDGDCILLAGPRNPDLAERFKRQKGRWDADRRAWRLPAASIKSLPRVFANSAKADPGAETRARAAEIERWLRYVEEKALQGWVYQRGVEEATRLGIEAHPELAARLAAAIALAGKRRAADRKRDEIAAARAAAAKWLGFIEENLRNGKGWYGKGETVVREKLAILMAAGSETADIEGRLAALRQKHETKTEPAAPGEPTYRLHGGSGYGCHGWHAGQVTRNRAGDIEKGEPEFLFVLSSSQKFFREDGLSFGVGDESGYVYTAQCLAATEAESAPLRAELAAQAARAEARRRLRALTEMAQARGVRPEPWQPFPQGEKLHNAFTIYGGGDCWVIAADGIWYLKNNGGDGDCWAENNIRTGGAGAIGWRLDREEALEQEVRGIADILAVKTD